MTKFKSCIYGYKVIIYKPLNKTNKDSLRLIMKLSKLFNKFYFIIWFVKIFI